MWSTAQTRANEEATEGLKKHLLCRVIVLRGTYALDGEIIDHHADEKDQEYPRQWTDFPSGIHAASLGMPMRSACASLRRDFQHRGQ
jgi:hypothetical protein